MSRKLAREIAFKVVFSENFRVQNTELKAQENEKLIEALIQDNELVSEDNADSKDNISKEDRAYIESLINGITTKQEELDKIIKQYLKGWTMDRIGKTDLAILRLAVYEILYREDIPYKVSINEAVELAKTYCDETSPSFINGVLAGVVNSLSKDNKMEE